ncbi:MAG: hypothetical protein IPO21_18385 [Bacteroidales bacterium]|nr:hypothetical protein [Bacteroidales bacterium]
MNKYIITNFILILSTVLCAQTNDYFENEAFITWQKNKLRKAKTETRSAYDMPYDRVDRTISITAHISIINGDTLMSESAIRQNIDGVNRLFAPTGFTFKVCNFNYFHGIAYDTVSHYPKNENAEELMRKNYAPNTINIYFSNNLQSSGGDLVGGLAPMPYDDIKNNPDTRGEKKQQDDWVKIAAGYRNNPLLAKVIAHELGHYFGLFHPHEEGAFGSEYAEDRSLCASTGDLICDTPAEPTLTDLVESCLYIGNLEPSTALRDPAGKVYMPSVTNIMSYSPDECKYGFSEQQFDRMLMIYNVFRTYLR